MKSNAIMGVLIFIVLPLAGFYLIWKFSKDKSLQTGGALDSIDSLWRMAREGNKKAKALFLVIAIFLAISILVRFYQLVR
jgi:hypothetical protein